MSLIFVNGKESLRLHRNGAGLVMTLKYHSDDNIKLYINDVYSRGKSKKVYFWLNDGETTKGYVVLLCKKPRKWDNSFYFRLSREDYEQIAYNCQYVTIGRFKKVVAHRKVGKVQKYFIEQELKYKYKLYKNAELRNEKLRLEILELKNELNKLKH